MDAGAFVQENKRWLVGCAIGAIVWMIASSVIDSMYSYRVGGTPRGAPTEAYTQDTLDTVITEGEQLTEELERLKTELAFVVTEQYSKWSGGADNHLFVQGRKLRRAVSDAASDRDVIVEEKDITWEPETGVDKIRGILFGLDIIDEIQARLFAAHDQSKQHDEDAMGLYEIELIKLEPARDQRRRGRGRRGEIDLADWVTQQTVTLHFKSDEPTLATFLESCRKPNRTLILDKLQVTKPALPGEPCMVKATLSAISFLKKKDLP
tara:strand:+ start:39750 stop:40544 length:795 start_codon:yes stop_codon:yes gene_type:complete